MSISMPETEPESKSKKLSVTNGELKPARLTAVIELAVVTMSDPAHFPVTVTEPEPTHVPVAVTELESAHSPVTITESSS